MLAVCSDLDKTTTRRVYDDIMTYLNTTRPTPHGQGVGLEVGNTMYFHQTPGRFAYWNEDEVGREYIRTLVRSGHIDCFHSFGALATTRDHARQSLDDLERHGCRMRVWIDHSKAVTNFGPDIMAGQGDVPTSPAYHADLTIAHGVQYVSLGQGAPVIGQNRPFSLARLWRSDHPAASASILARTAAKYVVSRAGAAHYRMFAPNRLLRRTKLRDGQPVFEFTRWNPHWRGLNEANAYAIASALTERVLDRLTARQGASILYTHLAQPTPGEPFPPQTRAGFERLAEYSRRGDILVTTTRRLLGFCRATEEVRYTTAFQPNGETTIDLDTRSNAPPHGHPLEPEDLQGLTFYVNDPKRVSMTVDGTPMHDLRHNGPDHTGRPSVSIPWKPLEYPQP